MSSTDCPWLLTKKIKISDLNKMGNPNCGSLHNFFEEHIGNIVGNAINTPLKAITTGYAPEYDLLFSNGLTAEIKATSSKLGSAFIETGAISDEFITKSESVGLKPTGLSITQSDFYIQLIPGTFSKQDVIKVKIFLTSKLKEYQKNRPIERFSSKSPTYGFKLSAGRKDLCEITDGCIGHFVYNPETTEVDLTKFKAYTNDMAKVADVLERLQTTKFKGY